MEYDDTLIEGLKNVDLYDHRVSEFKVHETHSAWVLLTGTFAYKIKKPVDLGFLDFSTIDKRHTDCLEEIRLNRRLAPDIYLRVVPIYGSLEKPSLDGKGKGTPIEYAVQMRQFDPEQQLDRLIRNNTLKTETCLDLASRIAAFHGVCPSASLDAPFGTSDDIGQAVFANFQHLYDLVLSEKERQDLSALEAWTKTHHQRLTTIMDERKQAGFVRECHGDLHLANITMINGKPTPFDCLEFNPGLRWIDTISEIAFLVMDLARHQRRDLASLILNTYLEETGDYPGLVLFRYYALYRAMVRIKVTAIRRHQSPTGEATATLTDEIATGIELAQSFTIKNKPGIILMHGLSGSGKSLVSGGLLSDINWIRIRSDCERKRLFPKKETRYTPKASSTTYERLSDLTTLLIQTGFICLVDATFLKYWQREHFFSLGRKQKCPVAIIDLFAPVSLLRKWIRDRQLAGNDPSEADNDILTMQIESQEPLTEDERNVTCRIDSSQDIVFDEISEALYKIHAGQ